LGPYLNGYAVEPEQNLGFTAFGDMTKGNRPNAWESHPIANAVDSTFAASEILKLNQTFLGCLDSTWTVPISTRRRLSFAAGYLDARGIHYRLVS
jgi:hypothetical protein